MESIMKKTVVNILLSLCMGFCFVASSFAADLPPPDAQHVPEWMSLRALMFGDRPIHTGDSSQVAIHVNKNIDDASTVPIEIESRSQQSREDFIKKLYLIVDQNPIPTAVALDLSPSNGKLHFSTRLRIEKFTYIRAIGEMSSGELHMASAWVEVAGGCSAPGGKNTGIDPYLGKMKFKMANYRNTFKGENGEQFYRVQIDKPNVVKVQVRHPNESALAADMDAERNPNFIEELNITYNAKTLVSGKINFSISDNPAFKFHFSPHDEGQLVVSVKDTHDNTFTQHINVLGRK